MPSATPLPDDDQPFALTDEGGFSTLILDYQQPGTQQIVANIGVCGYVEAFLVEDAD